MTSPTPSPRRRAGWAALLVLLVVTAAAMGSSYARGATRSASGAGDTARCRW